MKVSAVVLAGGRSVRFGRAKLAEPIDGEPILWRTIASLRAPADDIVVVMAQDPTLALPADVREVHDPVPDGGPLIGAIAGLTEARHDVVLLVGGDMPWMRADVLALLIGALGPAGAAAALESEGRRQQLPIALRRDAALEVGRRLVDSGERRLGALLDALDVEPIAEPIWRPLDPDRLTLRDIDTPEDLPPPGHAH